jgi:hypothetical protein
MKRVARKTSRPAGLRLPHRPLFLALVLLACLPSLIFNTGVGRAVLLHAHEEAPLHAHVVGSSHDHHGHDHHHGHAHPHPAHEDVPTPGDDGVPVERVQGAVVRGAEATATVKFDLVTVLDVPVAPASVEILPHYTPTSAASYDAGPVASRAEVAALRAVVLLI